MSSVSSTQIIDALQWRYATKAFDPKRKVPADLWAQIEASLVLTPSSFGLHPWKALVITDPVLREKLVPYAWNQRQVADASHLVVFASKRTVTEVDIDRFLQRIAEVRGGTADALMGYRSFMVGDLITGERATWIREWAARQAYIALGQLMTTAALLGLDACPMEGFIPPELDRLLDLEKDGLAAVVLCAVGYRSGEDRYAELPKVRFEAAEVIEHR